MDGQPHIDSRADSRATRRRARLVRSLASAGVVPDPAWQDAFRHVPRHVFLERFFRASNDGRWFAVARGDTDWLDQVYADRVLVTQLDDDPTRWQVARDTGPVFGAPTSSSSQPAIMAVMLGVLDVAPGQQVLEIGTGTGYNAALLSHRLGSANVCTVDIDPDLVDAARGRLDLCGFTPTCVAGDGYAGHPPGAPYDRVLATCAVARIPPAWLRQTVPGGVVVTTLHRPLGAGLVRIEVGEDGTGQGRVLAEDGRFMPLRAHRLAGTTRPTESTGPIRPTALPAEVLTSNRSRFEFYAGLALPEAMATADPDGTTWLLHPDGSWVRHTGRRGRYQVAQGGPRPMWDVVEAAYAEWQSLGKPARDRFGITVTPEHQELWLDEPDGRSQWPL